MQAGQEFLAKKDVRRAIVEFRNAAQATPQNPEAHYQLGLAYLAVGDVNNAVFALRKALELNPKHAGAQLRLAQLMAGTGDPGLVKIAQQRLLNLVQAGQENPDALHTLALTEISLGDPVKAAQHLERAVAAAPQQMIFAVTLAETKVLEKDFKGAEEVLKKASESSPKSPDAAAILGRFYLSQGKYEEAERELRRALALDAKHVWAIYTLALVQYSTGRKQEAEQNLKRLADLSEPTLKPLYASFLMEQGRRDEAVKEFERLARQDPADRMARTRLVGAYVSANRSAEGQKVLEEALKKNPKDLDALLQRGEFAINAGKYREAEADLNQVVRLKPDSPEVHYAMAALHKARGATLLQRQELNQALQLNRAFLPARLELAKLLVSDSKTALDLLDKAPAGQQSLLPVIEQRNWILLAARQLAEARAGVDQGLAVARTADLLLQDGVLKIVEKRPNEGRQALREAMAKSPEDLRILGAIVQSYAMEKQMPAALQEIERHAAQHPQSAAVQYFLGTLFARTGDRVRAKQAFASAKAINPEFTAADLSTAQIDLLQADWTSARQTLNTLLATKGENAAARMWLGMVEASVGNHSAAIAAFRKVVDEQPNNPTALNNLAYLLAENANQPDEALKWAQKAKELEPGSARVDDTLGWVLYHKGLYTEAIRYLEGANAKEGTAIRKYHLAMAYLKAGQKERGRAAFQAAARLDPNLPEVKTARELFQ